MTNTYSYEQAKSVLLNVLKRESELHRAKQYGSLGKSFDAVDAQLPRNSGCLSKDSQSGHQNLRLCPEYQPFSATIKRIKSNIDEAIS